eukprot:402496-Amorphochlora_amoeboformis.AAC.1
MPFIRSRDVVLESNVAVRTKCAGVNQHYGTDNIIRNNILYDVNVGDVKTPGRSYIMYPGRCDEVIVSDQTERNISTCDPNKKPSADCCCYPGCDMAMCSSATVDTNIVYLSKSRNMRNQSSFQGARWYHAFDNFTFDKNVYFAEGREPSLSRFFNDSSLNQHEPRHAMTLFEWQNSGQDAASVWENPQFVSSNGTNFTVSPESPALKL